VLRALIALLRHAEERNGSGMSAVTPIDAAAAAAAIDALRRAADTRRYFAVFATPRR